MNDKEITEGASDDAVVTSIRWSVSKHARVGVSESGKGKPRRVRHDVCVGWPNAKISGKRI